MGTEAGEFQTRSRGRKCVSTGWENKTNRFTSSRCKAPDQLTFRIQRERTENLCWFALFGLFKNRPCTAFKCEQTFRWDRALRTLWTRNRKYVHCTATEVPKHLSPSANDSNVLERQHDWDSSWSEDGMVVSWFMLWNNLVNIGYSWDGGIEGNKTYAVTSRLRKPTVYPGQAFALKYCSMDSLIRSFKFSLG